MFNRKSENGASYEKEAGKASGSVTIIGNGTTLRGDIKSNGDLRIEGNVFGNIRSASKIVVAPSGLVEGDITANQADVAGKVSGHIRVKDLLQLKGDSSITGNLYAAKLQVEPTVTFNGQCHIGGELPDINTIHEKEFIQEAAFEQS